MWSIDMAEYDVKSITFSADKSTIQRTDIQTGEDKIFRNQEIDGFWIYPFIYKERHLDTTVPYLQWTGFESDESDVNLDKYRLPYVEFSTAVDNTYIAYLQTLAQMKSLLIQAGADPKRSWGMVKNSANAKNLKMFKARKTAKNGVGGGRRRATRKY
jgi:hypothetical protein